MRQSERNPAEITYSSCLMSLCGRERFSWLRSSTTSMSCSASMTWASTRPRGQNIFLLARLFLLSSFERVGHKSTTYRHTFKKSEAQLSIKFDATTVPNWVFRQWEHYLRLSREEGSDCLPFRSRSPNDLQNSADCSLFISVQAIFFENKRHQNEYWAFIRTRSCLTY